MILYVSYNCTDIHTPLKMEVEVLKLSSSDKFCRSIATHLSPWVSTGQNIRPWTHNCFTTSLATKSWPSSIFFAMRPTQDPHPPVPIGFLLLKKLIPWIKFPLVHWSNRWTIASLHLGEVSRSASEASTDWWEFGIFVGFSFRGCETPVIGIIRGHRVSFRRACWSSNLDSY